MMWLNRRRRRRGCPVKDYSVGELFKALAVVSSVVESVSESGVRPAGECKIAEDAVANLIDFFGF